MTRWARVGSTQKHQKTPGDSTPWDELSKDAKKNLASNDDKINRIQKGRIEKKKHNLDTGGLKKFTQSGFQTSKMNEVKSEPGKGKLFKNKKLQNTGEKEEIVNDNQNSFAGLALIEDEDHTDNLPIKVKKEKGDPACLPTIDGTANGTGKVLTKNQRKKARRKMKLQEKKAENSQNASGFEIAKDVKKDKSQENNVASPNKVLGKKKSPKKRKNRQEEIDTENAVDNGLSDNVDSLLIDENEGNKKQKSMDVHVEAQNDNSGKVGNKDSKSGDATEAKRMTKKQWKKARKMEQLKATQSSQSQETSLEKTTEEKSIASLDKDFLNKKQLLLEKLDKKQRKDGGIILPSRVERKIFNIKRALMNKGLSPKILADIVRKERKREEEKFKKTFSTKPCFNCRQIGHLLSDCPLPLGDSHQETGLCFKCGSSEHTSYKCTKEVEGYPLAKCFVCKEQGHISKDCPKSDHGLYVKGGKCSMCGNVNHLRKDCPSSKKGRKGEDTVMTVGTINEGRSVDEEILQPVSRIPKKKFIKPKVVKF